MDVTLRFYDASDLNLFREHSYIYMKDFSVSFIKDVVGRCLNAYLVSIEYLVTKQFVSDDVFVFNIILDATSLPGTCDISLLDDLAFTIKSVILCHCK